MRITTGMIQRRYNADLNRATYALNKSAVTAYDFRAFEKPSEDPFLAAQAFQIRRQLALNENYTSNIENSKDAFSAAQTALQTVSGALAKANDTDALRGITATSSQSDRDTVADILEKARDALVSTMNAQYGNRYLFAGAGGDGAPFSVDESGNLLYRGVNVDTGVNTNGASATIGYTYGTGDDAQAKTMQINFGKAIGGSLNGYSIEITAGTALSATVDTTNQKIAITVVNDADTPSNSTTKQDLQDYLQGDGFFGALKTAGLASDDTDDALIHADDLEQINISNIGEVGKDAVQASDADATVSNLVGLNGLSDETSYVDIGLGIKTDPETGAIVDQSAFNLALPGINYLGFGQTAAEDGTTVPNNVYSLLTKMAATLRDTRLNGSDLMDAMKPYMDNFTTRQESLASGLAGIGAQVNFLDSTSTYVDNVNLNLSERDENVEFVDATDAVVNYSMQKYCYTAALQVGTTILQKSLLDYMT